MKLYIMKRDALYTLKENLPEVYGKYYTEKDNHWIKDVCGEDPFIEFKDVPEIELAELNSDLRYGEIDQTNCKILYEKMKFLSESQASDERLWVGLSHSTFYDYMRRRWKYGSGRRPKSKDRESGEICSRFFLKGGGRGSLYTNTLAKYWWVGHNAYDPSNLKNHFEALDIIGSSDIVSKIHEIFHSYTFSSNPVVMLGIVDSLRRFNEDEKKLLVKKHIRPALQYLNAVGGSVVIDCLTSEEISDIFTDAITAIMQGDTPVLNFSNSDNDDQDDPDLIEDLNEENDDSNGIALGSIITIRNNRGEVKSFKYNFINGMLPDTLSVFTGHKEGNEILFQDEMWKIEDISL